VPPQRNQDQEAPPTPIQWDLPSSPFPFPLSEPFSLDDPLDILNATKSNTCLKWVATHPALLIYRGYDVVAIVLWHKCSWKAYQVSLKSLFQRTLKMPRFEYWKAYLKA
jgi:hypothetical protein